MHNSNKKDNEEFLPHQLSVMRKGKKARKHGVKLEHNPYLYHSELQEYCLWAAGWHGDR